MSRRARQRRQVRIVTDPISLAIANARAIAPDDVAMHERIMQTALDEFSRGLHCHAHWLSMADCANMAQTLAEMRIVGGAEVMAIVHASQATLAAVMQRHQAGGSWTLRAPELASLRDLVWLHTQQLRTASHGEFSRAAHITAERVSQARAGNAPRDAIVIEGQLNAQTWRSEAPATTTEPQPAA
jgi:hypothetical protein